MEYIQEYNKIIDIINNKCILYAGSEFDFPLKFSTTYNLLVHKEDKTEYEIYQKIIENLPDGIEHDFASFDENITHSAYKKIYTVPIKVSENYSNNEWEKVKTQKVLIFDKLDKNLLEQAHDFKDKINTNYHHILEKFYNFINLSTSKLKVTTTGICAQDSDEHSFMNENLPDLTENFQILGFAIAFAEYCSFYIKQNEKYELSLKEKYCEIEKIECAPENVPKKRPQEW